MNSILEITEITLEVVNYYKNNTGLAKIQYDDIIRSAKSRGLDKTAVSYYTEKHHIVPRCLNGSDEDSNLVLLSYKEHIIVHMLLYSIYPDNRDLFLSFSLLVQLDPREGLLDLSVSLDYLEDLKITRSEFMRGEKNPMKNPEISVKVSAAKKGKEGSFKGHHHSEETKKILSQRTKDLGWTGDKHPMFGKHHTQETKDKISKANKGKSLGQKLSEKHKRSISEGKKRKVIGPDGTIYNSVAETAKAVGVGRDVISRYINHKPEKGFKYYID